MSKRCPGSRVATHVCLVVMRALHPAAAAQVAELLVSAAAEFADQRAPAQLAPIGLPTGVTGAFAPDGTVIALVEERDDAVRPVAVF